MAMSSRPWNGLRSFPPGLRAIRILLVLCLIAAAGQLLGEPFLVLLVKLERDLSLPIFVQNMPPDHLEVVR